MKQLGNLVAFGILVVNLLIVGLLAAAAYSPRISPTEHPTLSCLGLTFPIFWVLNICFLIFWIAVQRYKSALVPLAGMILCWGQACDYCPINIGGAKAPQESFELLSYNVMAFGGGKEEGKDILNYLKESGADILCLQEYRVGRHSRGVTQKEVEEALKAYPYRKIQNVGKQEGANNKIACYSKYPILSARALKSHSRYNGSAAYEVLVGKDTVLIVNNHLESNKLTGGDKEIYEEMLTAPKEEKIKSGLRLLLKKLAKASAIRAPQADEVARAVKESGCRYAVVCGDFNDTPVSYAHYTIGKGMRDAFRTSGSGPGISYNKNKFFFRIDHILTSKSLQPYGCRIDRSIKASDHYPIRCRIAKKKE